MNRSGRRGEHKLTTHNSRTMPSEFRSKVPAGHRAASCSCGGEFVARTLDELEQGHATHVLAVDAVGAGAQILHDEANVHVPVLHSPEGSDDAPFRDTLIIPLDEWDAMSSDERARWAGEEGTRRIDAHRAMIDEISSAPEPTPEERTAELEHHAKSLEAQWFDAMADRARLEAEALTNSEG